MSKLLIDFLTSDLVALAFKGDPILIWISLLKQNFCFFLIAFGAFEKKDDKCIPFEEVKLKMYRGETLANPIIRKKYLGK